MNPVIKGQWLKDLRSGEFEQGEDYLRKGGKFCCLGVLCEQAVNAGVIVEVEAGDGSHLHGPPDKLDEPWASRLELPVGVVDWAGLDSVDPSITPVDTGQDELATTLSMANDAGLTFAQIADIIEREL